MNKDRRIFKYVSFGLFGVVVITIARLVAEACIYGFVYNYPIDPILQQAGFTKEVMSTILIVGFVISILVLIPQFLVGYKGLVIANNKTERKWHLTLAKVLAVFEGLSVVSVAYNFVAAVDYLQVSLQFVNVVIGFVAYVLYIVYGTRVAKQDAPELFQKKSR